MFKTGIEALGGLSRYISRGDSVLVKVNAVVASPAILGATTHPDLLAAVVTACRQAGAATVRVTDNPINSPESCFEVSGLAQAARQAEARLLLPKPGFFTPVSLPQAKLIKDWPVMGLDRRREEGVGRSKERTPPSRPCRGPRLFVSLVTDFACAFWG